MDGYSVYAGSPIRQTITAATDAIEMAPHDTKGAAISVAFLLIVAALFLTLLKRSGFRAMVAVGRG